MIGADMSLRLSSKSFLCHGDSHVSGINDEPHVLYDMCWVNYAFIYIDSET